MKKLIPQISLFLFVLSSFAQVNQKIMVEHFTNSKCSNCANRNPGLYNNLSNFPDILHLAVYPSSPYIGCLIYQQNDTANDARTNYYGVYGSTPRLVINGNVISPSADYSSSTIFSPYQSLTSPASIRIVQEKFGTDSIRATVIIKTEAINSLGGLSLFVALAEDTVFYTGSNGEPLHYNVFRKSLTSPTGNPLTLPATVGDSLVFTFSSSTKGIWDFTRIYTLAILQQTASKGHVQAEAALASEGITGVNPEFSPIGEAAIFPNPGNTFLTILLKKEVENASVKVSNILGEVIKTESHSGKEFFIETRDLKAGIYFISVGDGKKVFLSRKVVVE